jgi:amino acid transporter
METSTHSPNNKPEALTLLSSHRPRNLGWIQAAGLLFGDWGTSRLYVLGLALFYAGRTSFWLIVAMSLLILAVGWAYSQICRIYHDGGGVYTAAKRVSRTLAVVSALLLFADYTVTASLSALDAFHYFGLPFHHQISTVIAHPEHSSDTTSKVPVADAHYDPRPQIDAGSTLDTKRSSPPSAKEGLLSFDSPGLWAIVAIALIGLLNLLGPSHSSGFAIAAAVGMVFITLLITAFALPEIHWAELPSRIGRPDFSHPGDLWIAFVSIVLALSGVEAIANLTGVMHKPVSVTSAKAIWVVAAEVAIFNVLLAVFMLAIFPINRDAHLEDMAAFLSGRYVGVFGEWAVRIIGGVLLLSAGNTAVNGMIAVQYLLARDGELPESLAKLNRFGVPVIPTMIALGVPIVVLIISHDLDALASLYAIGVIGAVAINITLCAFHPRLRKIYRKVPLLLLGFILVVMWITLAWVKRDALIFVSIVMVVGLSARKLNKVVANRRGPKISLLRQAVMSQLGSGAMSRSRVLIGTYGSDALARPALEMARQSNSTLVVCFIRKINLSYKWDRKLSMETDHSALRTFARFLELGHEYGVPVLPVYDSGENAVELLAETAAITGCDKVLIGTSRRGGVYQLLKGTFQQNLEALLPPEIPVQVIAPPQEPENIFLGQTTSI